MKHVRSQSCHAGPSESLHGRVQLRQQPGTICHDKLAPDNGQQLRHSFSTPLCRSAAPPTGSLRRKTASTHPYQIVTTASRSVITSRLPRPCPVTIPNSIFDGVHDADDWSTRTVEFAEYRCRSPQSIPPRTSSTPPPMVEKGPRIVCPVEFFNVPSATPLPPGVPTGSPQRSPSTSHLVSILTRYRTRSQTSLSTVTDRTANKPAIASPTQHRLGQSKSSTALRSDGTATVRFLHSPQARTAGEPYGRTPGRRSPTADTRASNFSPGQTSSSIQMASSSISIPSYPSFRFSSYVRNLYHADDSLQAHPASARLTVPRSPLVTSTAVSSHLDDISSLSENESVPNKIEARRELSTLGRFFNNQESRLSISPESAIQRSHMVDEEQREHVQTSHTESANLGKEEGQPSVGPRKRPSRTQLLLKSVKSKLTLSGGDGGWARRRGRFNKSTPLPRSGPFPTKSRSGSLKDGQTSAPLQLQGINGRTRSASASTSIQTRISEGWKDWSLSDINAIFLAEQGRHEDLSHEALEAAKTKIAGLAMMRTGTVTRRNVNIIQQNSYDLPVVHEREVKSDRLKTPVSRSQSKKSVQEIITPSSLASGRPNSRKGVPSSPTSIVDLAGSHHPSSSSLASRPKSPKSTFSTHGATGFSGPVPPKRASRGRRQTSDQQTSKRVPPSLLPHQMDHSLSGVSTLCLATSDTSLSQSEQSIANGEHLSLQSVVIGAPSTVKPTHSLHSQTPSIDSFVSASLAASTSWRAEALVKSDEEDCGKTLMGDSPEPTTPVTPTGCVGPAPRSQIDYSSDRHALSESQNDCRQSIASWRSSDDEHAEVKSGTAAPAALGFAAAVLAVSPGVSPARKSLVQVHSSGASPGLPKTLSVGVGHHPLHNLESSDEVMWPPSPTDPLFRGGMQASRQCLRAVESGLQNAKFFGSPEALAALRSSLPAQQSLSFMGHYRHPSRPGSRDTDGSGEEAWQDANSHLSLSIQGRLAEAAKLDTVVNRPRATTDNSRVVTASTPVVEQDPVSNTSKEISESVDASANSTWDVHCIPDLSNKERLTSPRAEPKSSTPPPPPARSNPRSTTKPIPSSIGYQQQDIEAWRIASASDLSTLCSSSSIPSLASTKLSSTPSALTDTRTSPSDSMINRHDSLEEIDVGRLGGRLPGIEV